MELQILFQVDPYHDPSTAVIFHLSFKRTDRFLSAVAGQQYGVSGDIMTFPPSAMSAPCPPEGNSGEETKETAGIEQVEAPEGNDHQAPSAASSSLLVGPTSNFSQRQTSHSVERESSVSPRLLSAIVSVKHDEWNTRWDDDSVENDVAEDGHDEEGNSIDKVIGTDVDQPTSSPALIASRSMPASLVTSCPCKSPRKVSDEGLLRSSDQGALRTPAQTSTRAQPGDPPARFGSTPNFHRKAMASSGTPGQRSLHHRKPSVPRLGMLQNAQDLASSGAVSSIVSPRRRTTEPNIQMVSESAFRPMESSSTGHADPADVTTSGEAAKSRLPHGGHLNSGVVEGCTGGEYRSLKARANSLKRVLGNLPGPRRILHGEFVRSLVNRIFVTATSVWERIYFNHGVFGSMRGWSLYSSPRFLCVTPCIDGCSPRTTHLQPRAPYQHHTA